MPSAATTAFAPPPPEVSCSADSLFELLAAFPVPQLLTTSTPLPTVPVSASEADSDDAVVDAVTAASQALVAGSAYDALRVVSPGAADGLSPLALRVHRRLAELETDNCGALSAPAAPAARPSQLQSQPERWTRSDETRMALRPRPPTPSLPTPATNITKVSVRRAVRSPQPKTAASPSPAASASASVAALIASDRRDAVSLRELCALLPGSAHPFRSVERARLTAFLAALLEPPAPGSVVGDAVMARATACCACVAHTSFDPEALADDTAAQLIELLAAVARRAGRRVRDGAGGRSELECLQALLAGLAALVCEPRVDVCGTAELLRLEEIGFDCLVRLPAGARDAAAAAECAAFVSGAAARLYRCVWARLDAQRNAVAMRFFARSAPFSDAWLQRHDALGGAMPITVAVLSAAQAVTSAPLLDAVRVEADADAHAVQCKQWAARVVAEFAHADFTERRERDTAAHILLQLCEDLARLFGQPEWPAADPLLRALLTHLAPERTQQLFVDAIFRVAQVIFTAPLASVTLSPPAIDAELVQKWRRLTRGGDTALVKKEEDTKSGLRCVTEADPNEDEEITAEEWSQAVVYFALTRRASDTSDRVSAALWRHARHAHILSWAAASQPSLSRHHHHYSAAIHALSSESAVASSSALPWADVCACAWRLCAVGRDAFVGAAGALRLLSPLLRVLRGPAAESARVHAAAHIARLAALHAPLLAHVWPAVQRCARDESARVREASVGLLTALVESDGAADRCAALLVPLLRDRSAAVAARAVGALEALLQSRRMDAAPQAVAAALSQLVALLAEPDSRHADVVARIFVRRWSAPSQRAAQELAGLAAAAAPHPHEISTDAPLARLLRAMASAAEAPAKNQPRHQQQQKQKQLCDTVNAQQLREAMAAAAKALWAEQRRLAPATDAAAALAAIAALAAARWEWVEPLLAALTETLALLPTEEMSAAARDYTGAALLHVCRTLREVFLSPRAPAVAFDDAARALTAVLARYVGPHQQRILVAAVGALSATITSGAEQDIGRANPRYLSVCYALMNTYYVRTQTIAPTLCRDPRGVSYVLRFLFLLSEFLRQYAGWRDPHRELAEPDVVGAGVPNHLARGEGICANVYAVVESVLSACPPDARGRAAVMALRVLSSLCMLQPAVFLRRCEPHLRRALDPAGGDAARQAQGLALVRDFIADEDARVDRAAALRARVPTELCAQSAAALDGRRRLAALATGGAESAAAVAEQNSGMAAWAMQRFHADIVELCGSGAQAVRSAALDVLRHCATGGLLPPARFAAALIALAADPQNAAVRRTAAACVAAQWESDEDVIASCAVLGITRAYDLHVACGVDVVQSAVVTTGAEYAYDDSENEDSRAHEPNGVGGDHYAHRKGEAEDDRSIGDKHYSSDDAVECMHGALYALLRKKHRDALVAALLRFFYSDAKAVQWLREHGASAGGEFFTDAPCPFFFLAHLTMVIATFPYASEADVIRAADGCRAVIDFAAQNSCDFIASHRQRVAASHNNNNNNNNKRNNGRGSRGRVSGRRKNNSPDASASGDSSGDAEALATDLWRSFGVLCAARLRAFLCRAFRLASAAAQKSNGRRRARVDARGRPRVPAVAALQRELSEIVRAVAPLWAPGGPRDETALSHAHDAIAAVLEAEERNALEATKRPRGRKPAKRTARRRVKAEPLSSCSSSESEETDSETSGTSASFSESESE